ncbi:MAG: glycosyltransferase 87 family protein [Gemmatimonadota bacterium]|nr:glycosyltransferase 87 family protein [Gemmatimonadota bacterium]
MVTLERFWRRHRRTVLRVAIVAMAVLAALKLGDEFDRLLFRPTADRGAEDLEKFVEITQQWFSGQPTYHEIEDAVYPPASYTLLWPLAGWLPLAAVRWLWGALSVGALAWLGWIFVRESGAEGRDEIVLVVLLLLSLNAVGATIGMGQLGLLQLPLLIAPVLALRRRPPSLALDLAVALAVLFALVKPNVSAPFFWLILFIPGRIRPAALVVTAYLLLTAVAMAHQTTGAGQFTAAEVTTDSVLRGLDGLRWGATHGGYGNIHTWLGQAGLSALNLSASLAVLGVFGFWLLKNRAADPWLLLGITGIVSRMWAYHRVYDDLLILLPMLALFRIAKAGTLESPRVAVAGSLLAITVVAMLAPARVQHFPQPWSGLFIWGHTLVWLADLVFLVHVVRSGRVATA